jgi:antitoxin MazE
MYIWRAAMQVSRWGNSLAVRLPAAVVEALGLKEGDEIAIEVADPRHFRVARDSRRDAALETLRTLGWILPDGFRFDREEANARGA